MVQKGTRISQAFRPEAPRSRVPSLPRRSPLPWVPIRHGFDDARTSSTVSGMTCLRGGGAALPAPPGAAHQPRRPRPRAARSRRSLGRDHPASPSWRWRLRLAVVEANSRSSELVSECFAHPRQYWSGPRPRQSRRKGKHVAGGDWTRATWVGDSHVHWPRRLCGGVGSNSRASAIDGDICSIHGAELDH
jgi:hypothetical protein